MQADTVVVSDLAAQAEAETAGQLMVLNGELLPVLAEKFIHSIWIGQKYGTMRPYALQPTKGQQHSCPNSFHPSSCGSANA